MLLPQRKVRYEHQHFISTSNRDASHAESSQFACNKLDVHLNGEYYVSFPGGTGA